MNVPLWVCPNRHKELEIPEVTALHELLAHMIIRQPVALTGRDVKFLRRRIGLSAKDFAARIGLSAVRLSQIENSSSPLQKRADLLFRLTFTALIASRDNKPFPSDLGHIVDELERSMNIGSHQLPPPKVQREREPKPRMEGSLSLRLSLGPDLPNLTTTLWPPGLRV